MKILKKLIRHILMLTLFLCFLFSYGFAKETVALKVGKLLNGNGELIKNAFIMIKNGKIEYSGQEIPVSPDVKVIEFKNGVATPGFIAANAYINVCKKTNEERSESTPEINLLNSIDHRASDFQRAWQSGVTCVYVAPGNLNVFNGMGTILKTQGSSPEEMLVKNNVQLKVTFGSEPAKGNLSRSIEFGLRTRRPQNRMGVIYIFRDAFITLQNKNDISDDQLSSQELIFRKVLKKEIPLRIRARSYMDIESAFRMMSEFGYKWILEDGVDAYRYINRLKENGVPVIYGPVYKVKGRKDFNNENDYYFYKTPVLLAENDVLLAFQNNEISPITSLRDEVIFAIRNGLKKKDAIKALTLNAAKILGVDNKIGMIEKGKDADILIFNGDPFQPSSRIEKVIINGKILNPFQENNFRWSLR